MNPSLVTLAVAALNFCCVMVVVMHKNEPWTVKLVLCSFNALVACGLLATIIIP